mgnify:CR=1 FL=1
MKYIKDIDIKDKKIVLRLDLNVPIKNGVILDDTKIVKSLETIKYLLDNNCHILMMSHLGKIKTEDDLKTNSLKIVCERLGKLLNKEIVFVENPVDSKIPYILNENQLVLLENTRYMDYPDKKESKCDLELAKFWASAGDVFVNDAFGTSHRKHASNYGVSKYLDSYYGLLFYRELEGLKPIIGNNIKHPFTVILGGAKVDDKIDLIKSLLKKCDYLLVGGGIANTFLKAKGYNIGASLLNEEALNDVKDMINTYADKIILPADVTVLSNDKVITCSIQDVKDNDIIYDIGDKTIKKYQSFIDQSATIFINGTMGLYEDERFAAGTKEILAALVETKAITIAGGGDAVSSINKFNLADGFDFLSTGGGATLEYITDEKIKCFEDAL